MSSTKWNENVMQQPCLALNNSTLQNSLRETRCLGKPLALYFTRVTNLQVLLNINNLKIVLKINRSNKEMRIKIAFTLLALCLILCGIAFQILFCSCFYKHYEKLVIWKFYLELVRATRGYDLTSEPQTLEVELLLS